MWKVSPKVPPKQDPKTLKFKRPRGKPPGPVDSPGMWDDYQGVWLLALPTVRKKAAVAKKQKKAAVADVVAEVEEEEDGEEGEEGEEGRIREIGPFMAEDRKSRHPEITALIPNTLADFGIMEKRKGEFRFVKPTKTGYDVVIEIDNFTFFNSKKNCGLQTSLCGKVVPEDESESEEWVSIFQNNKGQHAGLNFGVIQDILKLMKSVEAGKVKFPKSEYGTRLKYLLTKLVAMWKIRDQRQSKEGFKNYAEWISKAGGDDIKDWRAFQEPDTEFDLSVFFENKDDELIPKQAFYDWWLNHYKFSITPESEEEEENEKEEDEVEKENEEEEDEVEKENEEEDDEVGNEGDKDYKSDESEDECDEY